MSIEYDIVLFYLMLNILYRLFWARVNLSGLAICWFVFVFAFLLRK